VAIWAGSTRTSVSPPYWLRPHDRWDEILSCEQDILRIRHAHIAVRSSRHRAAILSKLCAVPVSANVAGGPTTIAENSVKILSTVRYARTVRRPGNSETQTT
jgi:hypothetical protein